MTKTLLLMVGLPRSGKTTWAQGQKHPIVCPDAIRLALHGQQFRQESEAMVWAIAHTMVRSLFLAGHNTVILDACNNTVKRRAEWISPDWNLEARYVTTSQEKCVSRAEAENYLSIIPIIEKMYSEHESPDELNTLNVGVPLHRFVTVDEV